MVLLLLSFKERMSQNQKNNTRLGWTQKEQSLLRSLYQLEGVKSWIQISTYLNKTVKGTKRSPKQCRERYNNFVKLNNHPEDLSEWTFEENEKLFDIYLERGSKWVEISKSISGRSQNFLKNRFYGSLRKTLNMINRLCAASSKKIKPIKYLTLTKILQRKQTISEIILGDKTPALNEKLDFCQKLKIDLIEAAKRINCISLQEAQDITDRAHKFNVFTRFENMARNRSLKGNKKPIKNGKAKNNLYNFDNHILNSQRVEDQKQVVQENCQQTNAWTRRKKFEQLQKIMQQLLPYEGLGQEQIISNEQNLEQDLCMILKTQYKPNNFNFLMPL